jgi:dissimilatory sulfite reductase (desulfoviridin) alpha/beta subunit
MVEDVLNIVTKLISVDALVSWLGRKLAEDYGVENIEVKRVKDAVVLVIKGSELDKVEKELREAVSKLGVGEKIEIEIGDGNGL